MVNFIIHISSDALMEMSLATLEAYVVPQCTLRKSSKPPKTELETYGLLWGHEVRLPDGDFLYHVEKMTVDAMAERRHDFVIPSEGMGVMKDMVTSFWPQYALLGSFHSHPYDHYLEVNKIKGYEFSEADRQHMIALKCIDGDIRLALVMTIASLKKISDSVPQTIDNHIVCWTMSNYRFWLTACIIEYESGDDENDEDSENADEMDDVGEESVLILPNSSDWDETYEHDVIGGVYLHCPYLSDPWQVTAFGKKVGLGRHLPGTD